MWQAWMWKDIYIKFWLDKLKEKNYLKSQGVDEGMSLQHSQYKNGVTRCAFV